MSMYYFAYGSNMDETQMRERCPDSRLIGTAVLKDYAIAFTIFSPKRQCGCADIISTLGDEVWGLLYEISDDDIERLDGFEGVEGNHYRRISVSVVKEDESIVEAQTYEVEDKKEDLYPSAEYLNIMKDAALIFAMPATYRAKLGAFSTK